MHLAHVLLAIDEASQCPSSEMDGTKSDRTLSAVCTHVHLRNSFSITIHAISLFTAEYHSLNGGSKYNVEKTCVQNYVVKLFHSCYLASGADLICRPEE